MCHARDAHLEAAGLDLSVLLLLPHLTLQVRAATGQWHSIELGPNQLLVMAGHALEYATCGLIRSSYHRVSPRCRGRLKGTAPAWASSEARRRQQMCPSTASCGHAFHADVAAISIQLVSACLRACRWCWMAASGAAWRTSLQRSRGQSSTCTRRCRQQGRMCRQLQTGVQGRAGVQLCTCRLCFGRCQCCSRCCCCMLPLACGFFSAHLFLLSIRQFMASPVAVPPLQVPAHQLPAAHGAL